MAGIIAQLTRAARIRRDRKHYGTNKCLYTLEPFDTNGFKVDRFPYINTCYYGLIPPGWTPQQVLREEGALGGAPEDDAGGGGHDHGDIQTVQGHHRGERVHHMIHQSLLEGAGGAEAEQGEVGGAAVPRGHHLHRPGARPPRLPPRHGDPFLLRNYLHRYTIIRKVSKSFQITFKVTLAK